MKSNKLSISGSWLSLGGCLSILVGLGWDGILHGQDPTLAEHEGIFTLSNPGHLLFAGGIALVVLGAVLFLLGQAQLKRIGKQSKAIWVGYFLGAMVLLGVAAGSVAIAASSGGGLLDSHHHSEAEIAAAVTAVPITPGATTTAAGHHDENMPGMTTPAAQVSSSQKAAADKLVSDTTSGIARLKDFNTAQAEGYKQITPYVLGQGANKYGPAHFYNAAYDRDGHLLDPSKPEALVYFRMADGSMLLLGSMYLAPVGQGPTPGGSLTMWHTHDNLCAGKLGVVIQNAQGNCPIGSTKVGDKEEMLHVWTFDNPDGPFAHNLTRADYAAALKQLA